MWMAMDPPTVDQLPQEGVLNVRDFSIRGESTLEKVAANGNDPSGRMPQAIGSGVSFSRMRAEFTRAPGKLSIRDGVVWGPAIGATLEGQFDYARDDVRLRGTFVPAYALNNFLAHIPVIGFFVGGGQNEGVFGMTYEVTGPQGNATLRINPVSMVAPGFLRKIFQIRGTDGRQAVPAVFDLADKVENNSAHARECGHESKKELGPRFRGDERNSENPPKSTLSLLRLSRR